MELEKEVSIQGDQYTVRSVQGHQERGVFYCEAIELVGSEGEGLNEFYFHDAVEWSELGWEELAAVAVDEICVEKKRGQNDKLAEVLADAVVDSSSYTSPRYINENTKQASVLKAVVAHAPSTRIELIENLGENREEDPTIQGSLTALKDKGLVSIIWWDNRYGVYVPTALGFKEAACMWGTPYTSKALEKAEEEEPDGLKEIIGDIKDGGEGN